MVQEYFQLPVENFLVVLQVLSLLLFLFMYIFALLGMELFSNIALVDGDDNLVVGDDV